MKARPLRSRCHWPRRLRNPRATSQRWPRRRVGWGGPPLCLRADSLVLAGHPANPLPRPRPLEADIALPETRPADPKAADPLTSLVKTTSTVQATSANIPRPPLAVPVSSRVDSVPVSIGGSHRVAAVLRALSGYGYGSLEPTCLVC